MDEARGYAMVLIRMHRIFLYGTFAGNRGDVLMYTAARTALEERGIHVIDREEEADAILNCCGYWCGDPWGELWSRKMRERIVLWKESGKKVILLPQTFGPFTNKHIAEDIRTMVDVSDLVCPRDAISYQHVTDLCGQRDNVQQFPDYTIDVSAIASDLFQPQPKSVAVIPNLRMTDKTDARTSALYLPFLGSVVALLRDAGADPFLLIHEEKDIVFADALKQEYPDLTVVIEPDAQKTKWIIGHSRAVISSRYHGILNALYQDIPVLATGWCHKFDALMEEWECADTLIDIGHTSDERLNAQITRLIAGGDQTKSSIQAQYRQKTQNMWEKVTQALT